MTGQTDTMAPTAAADADVERIPVVLVDGRRDRRSVMRQVFEHSGIDATVVAEADTGADAVDLVEQHGARVAVVELPHPLADGLLMIAELRRRLPDRAGRPVRRAAAGRPRPGRQPVRPGAGRRPARA